MFLHIWDATNTSLTGIVIGTTTSVATIAIIWLLIIIKKPSLYVLVSWFLTISTMVTVFLLSYTYGFEVTIGFVTAYFALSWIPLFLGLHPGIQAQSVLSIASIIITVEFLFILIIQLYQHSLSSFIPFIGILK